MTKKKRKNLFRIDGAPEKLNTQGICRRCNQICELYSAITNQGFLNICKSCMASGIRAGRKAPLPSHGKGKINDLMTYCVPGSYGGGKKR